MARHTRFYLDKRNGKLFGVCSGIADYLGINPLWVRIFMVVSTLAGLGFITVPGYILVALLAGPKPAELYDASPAEERFWQGMRIAPSRTLHDSRSRFRDIDRRLRDVETYVTSSNRSLAAEIDRLR